MHISLGCATNGPGLYEVTPDIDQAVRRCWPCADGVLNVFIRHTSCSLLIQENADPDARRDLESFLERLAPWGQSWHRHDTEGPDDSPAHMRSAVTATSLQIPVAHGRLQLGTWQGVFVFEHRRDRHQREILLSLMGCIAPEGVAR